MANPTSPAAASSTLSADTQAVLKRLPGVTSVYNDYTQRAMTTLDKDGMLDSKSVGATPIPRVLQPRFTNLEQGSMPTINGIVIHQTNSKDGDSVLTGYATRTIGAHFLILKDGTIVQTASLNQYVNHVGQLHPRCYNLKTCTYPMDASKNYLTQMAAHLLETAKPASDRYPWNEDSIGIELVGWCGSEANNCKYEDATAEQNAALEWLIDELEFVLGITLRGATYPHWLIANKHAPDEPDRKHQNERRNYEGKGAEASSAWLPPESPAVGAKKNLVP